VGGNAHATGTAARATVRSLFHVGSQNILIGNNISLPSATANGQLKIGNIIYGTGITGTGSTVSTGNIGIGTTSPDMLLSVGSNSPAGAHFENSTGSCYINPTTTSLSCSSDSRLKTNIRSPRPRSVRSLR
jgi:hypothetical protein